MTLEKFPKLQMTTQTSKTLISPWHGPKQRFQPLRTSISTVQSNKSVVIFNSDVFFFFIAQVN